jgi:hypothetical protein
LGDRLVRLWVDGTLEGFEVVSINYDIKSVGIFAPLTEDGTIVVEGFLASCYACPAEFGLTQTHAACNLTMWPLRSGLIEESAQIDDVMASSYARAVYGFTKAALA